MKLNALQQAKVRDLNRDPVFGSILKEAEKHATVPRYKPKGEEIDKHHQWIHKSGFADGVDFMVKLLRYDNE